ncbi:2-C-methyl-D-erythritol 2,4-cyclodiphosphate synthase [Candidatus Woesearchaeota archaeon CG11_big_fil_rev_8_21_14_0_20_43_8]|nr:MAG: 2-C-methyl-D-erythritol 2,4-cyclodiphosphate synthase [Candidatus Woesearchaeota archaeon CG11_big_fil_rev_8_21_14_0_20_43_8]PIO05076.1 MAG: 2-C-methyl-D-erythritol 2,4-cyclodiphosphate synthase [Candidatus Woesearchaeota archaeon CG08_land_8_20_14_0_20_43_7]
MYRIGTGQDSHRFSKDKEKKLVLGGIEFDWFGLEAKSDGDAVIHALCNAMSSAIGGPSISRYADAMREQGIIDSKEYLKKVNEAVSERGYGVLNISISIEAKEPQIEPKVDEMKTKLSELLDVDPKEIGITATSGEGLTSVGNGDGIQVHCSVMLKKK